MRRPSIIGTAFALLSDLAVACGGGRDATGGAGPKATVTKSPAKSPSPTPTGTPTGGDRVELEVEAEDFAFERSTYRAPAGAAVELELKNRDADIPHTFSVYENDSAQGEIFSTGNLVGVAERTYEFTAPGEPGTYFFRCDVHQDMSGDFVVE